MQVTSEIHFYVLEALHVGPKGTDMWSVQASITIFFDISSSNTVTKKVCMRGCPHGIPPFSEF